jgi:hypothetical protein
MSPLRRLMIEDMTVRKFASKTQRDYVQRVKHLTAFLGRSPDTASFENVRRYQLHLAASGAGVPTLNQSTAMLRFFFRVTLKRSDIIEHTTFIHGPTSCRSCSARRKWHASSMQRRGSKARREVHVEVGFCQFGKCHVRFRARNPIATIGKTLISAARHDSS